jgi:glycosyltransferase involved in cell wall biosynthesis
MGSLKSSERRRLLLISYHFPPGQAAGALRWQKLAGLAALRGWGVDVITLDAADVPAPDPSRLQELPEAVRVFGVRNRVPRVERFRDALYRLYRRLKPKPTPGAPPQFARRPTFGQEDVRWAPWRAHSWRRILATWIDYASDGAWARDAAKLGRSLFDPALHAAVISCGPPHMAHEGARRLSVATGLPLVMDFRDPWSLVDRLPENLGSPLWLHLAAMYEKRGVGRAALVVMNNDPARLAMQERHPERADHIITVLNGYDDEALPRAERDGRFRIVYTGSVYLDRNPRLLFRAVARLARELHLGPEDLGIEFMGKIEDVDGDLPLEAIAADEGVEEFVTLHPPGTREDALQLLARASVLLNLPQASHLAIPSKIYEYMRFDAWLLALAEQDSATELLLRDTPADVVDPDDADGLTAVLRRRYTEHAAGRRPQPIAVEERFSRRAQADQLFEAVERFTGPPKAHQGS